MTHHILATSDPAPMSRPGGNAAASAQEKPIENGSGFSAVYEDHVANATSSADDGHEPELPQRSHLDRLVAEPPQEPNQDLDKSQPATVSTLMTPAPDVPAASDTNRRSDVLLAEKMPAHQLTKESQLPIQATPEINPKAATGLASDGAPEGTPDTTTAIDPSQNGEEAKTVQAGESDHPTDPKARSETKWSHQQDAQLATKESRAKTADPVDTKTVTLSASLATSTGSSAPLPVNTPAPVSTQPLTQSKPSTVIVASPQNLGHVIVDRVQTQTVGEDRITVQLDPPELGRVTVDFKYDSQGLPSITVTAESPEALRQLKLLHSELLNSLERNGISAEQIEYRDGQPGHERQPDHAPTPEMLKDESSSAQLATQHETSPSAPLAAQSMLPDQRLDIRL